MQLNETCDKETFRTASVNSDERKDLEDLIVVRKGNWLYANAHECYSCQSFNTDDLASSMLKEIAYAAKHPVFNLQSAVDKVCNSAENPQSKTLTDAVNEVNKVAKSTSPKMG